MTTFLSHLSLIIHLSSISATRYLEDIMSHIWLPTLVTCTCAIINKTQTLLLFIIHTRRNPYLLSVPLISAGKAGGGGILSKKQETVSVVLVTGLGFYDGNRLFQQTLNKSHIAKM